MKLFQGGNTYCDACEKVIDYTVEEKVEQGWLGVGNRTSQKYARL